MVRKGRRKEFGKFTKKIAAVGLALAMTVSTAIPHMHIMDFPENLPEVNV